MRNVEIVEVAYKLLNLTIKKLLFLTLFDK